MSETVEIVHQDNANGGEYRAIVPDSESFGRMTWRKSGAEGEDIRLVDHTIVPPEIGGRGIAGQLMQALIADAREQGFRIVPECSYVVAQFRRHPEWADLLAE